MFTEHMLLKTIVRTLWHGKPAEKTVTKTFLNLLPLSLPLAVFILSFLAFFPALQSGFVHLSDDDVLIQNPYYRGLSWHNLRWMFTTFYMGDYRPLTWLTYAIDYKMWGISPFGYHLTSLFLHAVNSVLFYFVAVRLLSLTFSVSAVFTDVTMRFPAAFAAFVFAIHPLRSEAVAWISARGHLLAALFFLLTIISYLRATCTATPSFQKRVWLVLALILYILSVLSQPNVIALPLILLILDVYPSRRLGNGATKWFTPQFRTILWEKASFFVVALAAGFVGLIAKNQTSPSSEALDLMRRLFLTAYGLAFYGTKTLVPSNLSPGYEIRFHFDPLDQPFLVSAVAILAISVVLFAIRNRWPAGLASWLYYLLVLVPYVGFLLPVVGNVENGRLITPDRYSYIACFPLSLLAGGSLYICWATWRQRQRFGRFLLSSLAVAAVAISLLSLTWRQTGFWHDSYSLWKHAVDVTHRSRFKSLNAHNGLGIALAEQNKFDEAIAQFSEALRIGPNFAKTHNNLGIVLAERGSLDEAIIEFLQALRITPDYAQAHYNLGVALHRQGKTEEANVQFSLAQQHQ